VSLICDAGKRFVTNIFLSFLSDMTLLFLQAAEQFRTLFRSVSKPQKSLIIGFDTEKSTAYSTNMCFF
jgi:hypothetical protein